MLTFAPTLNSFNEIDENINEVYSVNTEPTQFDDIRLPIYTYLLLHFQWSVDLPFCMGKKGGNTVLQIKDDAIDAGDAENHRESFHRTVAGQ